ERDLLLREREQANQDADIELKRKEQATSKWRSPLVVAIFAAAIAGVGNAGVAALNGWYQRDLDGSKRDAERALEENKAESTRVLEMIKTGDTETAAKNIAFLLDTGLVTEPIRVGKLREFLANRRPGTGPALPSPSRFGFEPSDLPSSVQAVLQANLENYIRYLDDIGFPATDKTVKIRIVGKDKNLAYFPGNNELNIPEDMVTDVSAALEVFGHNILLNVQSHDIVTSGEENVIIELALAIYFSSSFLQKPTSVWVRKSAYLVNMENKRKFSEVTRSHREKAEIWCGLFWELSQHLTREKFDPILVKAWQTVTFTNDGTAAPAVFVEAMLGAIRAREPLWLKDAQDVLKKREFPARG